MLPSFQRDLRKRAHGPPSRMLAATANPASPYPASRSRPRCVETAETRDGIRPVFPIRSGVDPNARLSRQANEGVADNHVAFGRGGSKAAKMRRFGDSPFPAGGKGTLDSHHFKRMLDLSAFPAISCFGTFGSLRERLAVAIDSAAGAVILRFDLANGFDSVASA